MDQDLEGGPRPREAGDIQGLACHQAGPQNTFSISVQARAWARAASHEGGRGLEKGPPRLGPAQDYRRVLRRRGDSAQIAALDQVVCGGVSRPGRFADGASLVAHEVPVHIAMPSL